MPIQTRRDLVPWVVRALWVLLPFTAGPAFADWLSPTSHPVRTLSSVLLWVAWGLGILATLVPHPLSLTALRFMAPGAAALAVDTAIRGYPSALAVGWTLVLVAWIFAPAFGEWCVNGPAYPNERRHLLRAPGSLVVGLLALVVAWDLAVAGLVAGPLLLAARQWVAGGVLTVVGWAVAAVFLRSLHSFSRRWVVFVPAGVVVHDPVSLRDPVLFGRRALAGIGPAGGKRDGVADLTQRAAGLAVQLQLREPLKLTLMKPGRRLGIDIEAETVMFTPTRPGAVLEEARTRRLPVTAASDRPR
ncbi:MAG TPA: hypothetical protein VM121_08260 [Acidimicrobiales bacterium]|nr:hypothetical protein [Acidimicrobiales bacterium]